MDINDSGWENIITISAYCPVAGNLESDGGEGKYNSCCRYWWGSCDRRFCSAGHRGCYNGCINGHDRGYFSDHVDCDSASGYASGCCTLHGRASGYGRPASDGWKSRRGWH